MKGRPYLALVFSMIFWSFSFVWFKIANRDYDPITIVFIRLAVASVFLSTFLWLTKGYTKIAPSDRKYFLLLAIFEPFPSRSLRFYLHGFFTGRDSGISTTQVSFYHSSAS